LMTMLACAGVPVAGAATTWTEGKHYEVVTPVSGQTLAPGQQEVTEVFSYGCPACAHFSPIVRKLQQALPKGVKFTFIPASFNPAEDWPMFQRAYYAAEKLGVADQAHDAVFDAVWKGGPLEIADPATHRLKNPMPTIEDAARFYSQRTGVKAEDFVAVAKSFTVEMKMKEADKFVRSYQVLSTPTLLVNRRYRIEPAAVRGDNELVELVGWLLAKDKT
jgi:protein dithiol oxidoreductase (disulfide-forming)